MVSEIIIVKKILHIMWLCIFNSTYEQMNEIIVSTHSLSAPSKQENQALFSVHTLEYSTPYVSSSSCFRYSEYALSSTTLWHTNFHLSFHFQPFSTLLHTIPAFYLFCGNPFILAHFSLWNPFVCWSPSDFSVCWFTIFTLFSLLMFTKVWMSPFNR